ncbi:hypothetical protein ACOME3_002941 [Neoechinorhynchus agilis]
MEEERIRSVSESSKQSVGVVSDESGSKSASKHPKTRSRTNSRTIERIMEQATFVRYLEAVKDDESTDFVDSNIDLIKRPDFQEHDMEPIVYRELPGREFFEKPKSSMQLNVHDVKEQIDSERMRPILIERWLTRDTDKRIDRDSTPTIVLKDVKEHVKPAKIVQKFYNLGTKKIDADEYLKRYMNEAAEVVMFDNRLFLRSSPRITDKRESHKAHTDNIGDSEEWKACERKSRESKFVVDDEKMII